MSKLRMMVLICFIAAFCAGLTAGMLWERSVSANSASLSTPVTPPAAPAVVEAPAIVAPVQPTQPPVAPRNPNFPPPPPQFGQQPGQQGKPDSWLSELKLSKEQSDKMGQIWSDMMKKSFTWKHDKHDAVRKERDEAIKALFTDEQRKAYENILETAKNKDEELNNDSRKLQEEAVRKTQELLTPEQRVKYDELRKKREQQWHGRRPDGRSDGRQDGRPDGRGDGRPDFRKPPEPKQDK